MSRVLLWLALVVGVLVASPEAACLLVGPALACDGVWRRWGRYLLREAGR